VTEAVRDVLEIGEAILDQRQPSFGLIHQREAARDGIAVTVDTDDRRAADPQNRAGMSACAERAVDIDAVMDAELLERLAGEHGNMTGQSASDSAFAVAARHHSRALCASCAATREPSCFFSARTVPVASASCARKRPGSQI